MFRFGCCGWHRRAVAMTFKPMAYATQQQQQRTKKKRNKIRTEQQQNYDRMARPGHKDPVLQSWNEIQVISDLWAAPQNWWRKSAFCVGHWPVRHTKRMACKKIGWNSTELYGEIDSRAPCNKCSTHTPERRSFTHGNLMVCIYISIHYNNVTYMKLCMRQQREQSSSSSSNINSNKNNNYNKIKGTRRAKHTCMCADEELCIIIIRRTNKL